MHQAPSLEGFQRIKVCMALKHGRGNRGFPLSGLFGFTQHKLSELSSQAVDKQTNNLPGAQWHNLISRDTLAAESR